MTAATLVRPHLFLANSGIERERCAPCSLAHCFLALSPTKGLAVHPPQPSEPLSPSRPQATLLFPFPSPSHGARNIPAVRAPADSSVVECSAFFLHLPKFLFSGPTSDKDLDRPAPDPKGKLLNCC